MLHNPNGGGSGPSYNLTQFYVGSNGWAAANIGATGVTIVNNPASGTGEEFAEAK